MANPSNSPLKVTQMTTKLELEKLMDECEACAGSDVAGFEAHFSECPKCKEYAEAAETSSEQIRFLEQVAARPTESAKQLFGTRVRAILALPPEAAAPAVRDLLDALGEVSEDARVKVVRVRTDLLMEIPKEHRETLMKALGGAMAGWPADRKAAEQRAVMKATEDYFLLKRMMVRKKFAALLN